MTPAQYKQACKLFLDVSEAPDDEREALLAQRCDDSTVRGQVEVMLKRADDDRLDVSPMSDLTGLADRAIRETLEPIPERIGAFRILHELGRGGMGVVYEAEQDSPHRRIALKVMRSGAGHALAKRFRQEAEVLALLTHPAIAQIHEAGAATTDSGDLVQYISMELVQGVPITEHASNHDLTETQRLELLVMVADGVDAAHRHGVVHRDLKPSNVLIAQDENGIGRPKILDFGIAKATNADLQVTTLATEVGQLMGTVAYMSPEQVSGDPSRIDARADIYALGIIAYELLVGKRPFDLEGMSVPEALRVIQEVEPESRSTLDRYLRGDVETIVRKALEKDPMRRYQSVAELSGDIKRFLRCEPIVARPPSAMYQLRKFTKRNKVFVGGVCATALALVLGLVGTTMFGIDAAANEKAARWLSYRSTLAAAAAALDSGQMSTARRLLEEAPPEHRGWEWDHLQSRLSPWKAAFDASGVLSLCVDSESGLLAGVLSDGSLAVWEVETQRRIASHRFDARLTAVSRSAHGGVCAATTGDGTVILIDLTTGQVLRRLGERSSPVWANVSLSDHSLRVCASRRDRVVVWSAQTGAEIRSIELDASVELPFGQSAISHDGTRVAVVSEGRGKAVLIYDVATGEKRVVSAPESPLLVAFSPDDRLLAVGMANRNINVHAADSLEAVAVLRGHTARVIEVIFRPDGRLVSLGSGGTIRFWNPETGTQLGVLGVPLETADRRKAMADVAARDVDMVATSEGDVISVSPPDRRPRLWSLDDRKSGVLRGHESYVYYVTWAPDGRHLASLPFETGHIRIWNADTLDETSRLPHAFGKLGSSTGPVSFSPNGSSIVLPAPDAPPELWNIDEGRKTRDLRRQDVAEYVGGTEGLRLGRQFVYSPDGLMLAQQVALQGPGVSITTGDTPIARLEPAGSRTGAVAWSPDGRWIVTTNQDTVVRVWSTRTFEEVAQIEHPLVVYGVAFSPDGTRLATGAVDGLVRLWTTGRWEQIVELTGHESYVYDLAFSPDGSRLASASGDHTVRIWDTIPRTKRRRGGTRTED